MVQEFPLQFYKRVWTLKEFLNRSIQKPDLESDEFTRFSNNVVVAEIGSTIQRQFRKRKQPENVKDNLDNAFWLKNEYFQHIKAQYDKEVYDELKEYSIFEKVDNIGWIQRMGAYADRVWIDHVPENRDQERREEWSSQSTFTPFEEQCSQMMHSCDADNLKHLENESKRGRLQFVEATHTGINIYRGCKKKFVETNNNEAICQSCLKERSTVSQTSYNEAAFALKNNHGFKNLARKSVTGENQIDEKSQSRTCENPSHLKRKNFFPDSRHPLQKKLCTGYQSQEPNAACFTQKSTKEGIDNTSNKTSVTDTATPLHSSASEFVERKWFLYSKFLKESPQVSKTCMPHFGNGKSKQLLARIFGLPNISDIDDLDGIDVKQLLRILESLLRKEKRFLYLSSLSHHCPVHISDKTQGLKSLLPQHSSHNQVYQFLRAVCHKVFPRQLFGCSYNQRLFEKRMKCLITAGMNDKIRVQWFLESFKLGSCSWLLNGRGSKHHEEYLKMIFDWMSKYLLYILRTYFYITESANSKLMLVFYRKSLWKKIETRAVNDMISSGKIEEIPKELYRDVFQNLQGKIRIIPKLNSCTVRAIVGNNKNKQLKQARYHKSIVAVLQYLLEKHSALRGSSSFNSVEIHRALKKFQTTRDKNKKLFGVTVDMEDCFGSVNHDTLLDIICSLSQFEGNIFRLHHYTILKKYGKSLRRSYALMANSKETCFEKHLQSKHRSSSSVTSSVYIDKSKGRSCYLNLLIDFMMKYVTDSNIQIGNKVYKVKEGLVQGGVISSQLCNLYISMFELGIMGNLGQAPGELLIRTVDDFLFLTHDVERADSFLHQITFGIPGFNLRVNKTKMVANFSSNVPGVKLLGEKELLKWNGLEIDLSNFSVFQQYSEFDCKYVQYTFSLETNCSGHEFKKRVLLCLNLSPIVLDSEIIGEQGVIVNLYNKFWITAKRIHCLLMNNLVNYREHIVSYLFGVIHEAALQLYRIAEFTTKKVNISLNVSMTQFYWLCYVAHLKVFQKHSSVYISLIPKLKREIFFQEMRLKERSLIQQMKEILQLKCSGS